MAPRRRRAGRRRRKYPKGLTCVKGRLKSPYRDKKGRMHYCKVR